MGLSRVVAVVRRHRVKPSAAPSIPVHRSVDDERVDNVRLGNAHAMSLCFGQDIGPMEWRPSCCSRPRPPPRPPAHPTRLGGRGRVGHGRGRRGGPATLAAHQLAQPRRRAAVGGRVCGAARDPSPRLAPPSPPRAGGVAVGRTRYRRHPADQILLRAPAGHGVVDPARPMRASALGDRAAVSRVDNRPRAGPCRRPHVSRLAPSRRAHRHRLQLPAGRAPPAPRRADLSGGARDRARDLHRILIRPTAALSEAHRGATVGAVADQTK